MLLRLGGIISLLLGYVGGFSVFIFLELARWRVGVIFLGGDGFRW